MACVEHICERCSEAVFNNLSKTPASCPKCGSRMIHCFDEDEKDYDDFEELDEKEDNDD